MKRTQKYALRFAERLRQVMKERNLRQTDVCKLIEPYCKKYGVCINKSHLSQYLSGNFYPALFNFSILCMALDVPMEWLCGIDDIDESEKNQEVRKTKPDDLERRIAILEEQVQRQQFLLDEISQHFSEIQVEVNSGLCPNLNGIQSLVNHIKVPKQ